MSKRIIFVITGLGLGGAEKQICLLADKLYLHNNEVNIVVLNGNVNVTPLNENIRIHNLHMKKNPLGLLNAVLRLVKIISYFKPTLFMDICSMQISLPDLQKFLPIINTN